MQAECPDLSAIAGRKYRLSRDESYHAEHGRLGRAEDPWTLIVSCRNGHVFPFGRGLLAASTNQRGPVAGKLLAVEGARVHQDADDGVTVVFPESEFKTVAKIMRARLRRQWSDAQRAKMQAAGWPFLPNVPSPERSQRAKTAV
ncbi:MAG TPA: hypothetical protein VN699_03440 [Pirellulales bacterium]|nr:hypothetical protein [Pirellulales bacterium]